MLWKQNYYKKSFMPGVLWQGGDSDANAAVAGALLGCKLGLGAIPRSWRENLAHKEWLDTLMDRWAMKLRKIYTQWVLSLLYRRLNFIVCESDTKSCSCNICLQVSMPHQVLAVAYCVCLLSFNPFSISLACTHCV